MQTGTITSNLLIGGVSFTSTVNRQAEGVISEVVSLPAGRAGAISATGGVDGLAAGHGFQGDDNVDIHWADPADGSPKCRRAVVVNGATENAIALSEGSGEGDALPAEDTAVVVSKPVSIALHWDGGDTELIAARCDGAAMLDFRTISASDAAVKLKANEAWSWANGQGIACPIVNTIAAGVASNGTTAARTLQVAVLYRSLE